MPFPNGKNLKSIRLLLFYQVIHARWNWSMAFPNGESLKSMRLLLLYQAIHARRNWSLTYLPIDGLHLFYRNCLITSLPTYDVNKKYPSYMPMISYCYCYLKLIGTFRDVAHCDISYCQKAFMDSIYFTAIT